MAAGQLDNFEKILGFLVEIEKLKAVLRKTKPVGFDRYENSAEHSWHVTLACLLLAPQMDAEIDVLKVLKMMLVHDVVEIDTGDHIIYSAAHDNYDEELQAAERLFGLLPEEQGVELLTIWKEFEKGESAEAHFARAIDRVIPVNQNLNNACQSWVENDVQLEQVLEKNAHIEKASKALWQYLKARIEHAAREGKFSHHA